MRNYNRTKENIGIKVESFKKKLKEVMQSEEVIENINGFCLGFTLTALPTLLVGRMLGYEFKK